jgi:beta-galactosidase
MQFEFKPATGFWLNGKNFKLKGMAVHQDGGAVGSAVPMSIWERRLTTLKKFGVNAVRCAHNPFDPDFLDVCDRVGILVMDELFDCWTVGKPNAQRGYNLYFNDWSKTDLRDTVQRDRNHPSIVLYSAGNEIHDTPQEDKAKGILRGLVDIFHECDPSRPVTQALFRPNTSHDYTNGLADMLDVIGTNYRDTELLAAQSAKPTRKIVGTEQGPEPRVWQICRDNPQYSGQFVFGGIDFPGEDSWPFLFSNAGILDRTGFPKHNAYQRLSWWSDAPMVHIARLEPGLANSDPVKRYGYDHIDNWTPMNPATYTQASVWVYSNCEQVELFLNGNSLGAKPLTSDPTARTWQFPYAPGTIRAVGRNKGQIVATHQLSTCGKPAKLVISTDRANLSNTWDDVSFVTVNFVDDQGIGCAWANGLVTFKLTGPGAILAVDAGDRTSHEPFKASQIKAFQGRCIAIIRATASSGPITVTASAPNLPDAAVTITATP